jgi:hypothetical protein
MGELTTKRLFLADPPTIATSATSGLTANDVIKISHIIMMILENSPKFTKVSL